MTLTKLDEVIGEELERVYWSLKQDELGCVPKHIIMISIESDLFDKLVDKLLTKVNVPPSYKDYFKEMQKLMTEQIQYADYTIVRQKKDLNKV